MKTLLIQIDIFQDQYTDIEDRTTATASVLKERNDDVKSKSVIFSGATAQRFGWD